MIFIYFIFYLGRVGAQTQWTDTKTGMDYDWTGLQKDIDNFYSIIDNTNPFTPSTYSFNFGIDIPNTCSGQLVSASENIIFADGWVASCSILGRKSMQKVSAIQNGIRITFNGGDVCFENNELSNRRIYFELTCSDTEGDWLIKESAYNNYCLVGLTKNSSFGCTIKTSRVWLWIVILTLLVVTGLIIYWNHTKKNEENFTLPYKDTIFEFFQSFREALERIVERVKAIRISKTKNYEMV